MVVLCLGIEQLHFRVLSDFCLIFSQPDTDMLLCVSDQARSGRYYAPGHSSPVKTAIVSLWFLQLLLFLFLFCNGDGLDCLQSPYFSVGFSRLVRFDGAAAILVCERKRDLGRVSKLTRGAGVGVSITPLSSPPQIALAFTNQNGGSSIETYQSRESHGKIGGL